MRTCALAVALVCLRLCDSVHGYLAAPTRPELCAFTCRRPALTQSYHASLARRHVAVTAVHRYCPQDLPHLLHTSNADLQNCLCFSLSTFTLLPPPPLPFPHIKPVTVFVCTLARWLVGVLWFEENVKLRPVIKQHR